MQDAYLDFVHIVDSLVELHRLLGLHQRTTLNVVDSNVDEQEAASARCISGRARLLGERSRAHLVLLGYQVLHGNLVALQVQRGVCLGCWHKVMQAGCHRNYQKADSFRNYLGQKGVKAQNQLNMAIEQALDLVNDAFSVNSAGQHWHHLSKQTNLKRKSTVAAACKQHYVIGSRNLQDQ